MGEPLPPVYAYDAAHWGPEPSCVHAGFAYRVQQPRKPPIHEPVCPPISGAVTSHFRQQFSISGTTNRSFASHADQYQPFCPPAAGNERQCNSTLDRHPRASADRQHEPFPSKCFRESQYRAGLATQPAAYGGRTGPTTHPASLPSSTATDALAAVIRERSLLSSSLHFFFYFATSFQRGVHFGSWGCSLVEIWEVEVSFMNRYHISLL